MMSGRCAACKYLRRRCAHDCIFSPHFPSNDPQRFASVHRIYGASNIAKMLQQVPEDLRGEAADTLCWEAQYRSEEPVYGCVAIISQLHQHIQFVEIELAKTQAHIAFLFNSNHHNTNTNINAQQQHHQFHQIGRESSSSTMLLPFEPVMNFPQINPNTTSASNRFI